MQDTIFSAKLIVFIVSLPLAVWLGAILTRSGGTVDRFVARHVKWLMLGSVVLLVVSGSLHRNLGSDVWFAIYVVSLYMCAMLIMPVLRLLPARSDRSRR